jgi:hypothetical protein
MHPGKDRGAGSSKAQLGHNTFNCFVSFGHARSANLFEVSFLKKRLQSFLIHFDFWGF